MNLLLSLIDFVRKYVPSTTDNRLMLKWYKGNSDRRRIYQLEIDALELSFDEFFAKNSSRYGTDKAAEDDYNEMRQLPLLL